MYYLTFTFFRNFLLIKKAHPVRLPQGGWIASITVTTVTITVTVVTVTIVTITVTIVTITVTIVTIAAIAKEKP
jgi:hypothetical protein